MQTTQIIKTTPDSFDNHQLIFNCWGIGMVEEIVKGSDEYELDLGECGHESDGNAFVRLN